MEHAAPQVRVPVGKALCVRPAAQSVLLQRCDEHGVDYVSNEMAYNSNKRFADLFQYRCSDGLLQNLAGLTAGELGFDDVDQVAGIGGTSGVIEVVVGVEEVI